MDVGWSHARGVERQRLRGAGEYHRDSGERLRDGRGACGVEVAVAHDAHDVASEAARADEPVVVGLDAHRVEEPGEVGHRSVGVEQDEDAPSLFPVVA